MAAVYTQYNPVSSDETASNACLSVRQIRDTEVALNNGKRYAMVDKVLSHISPLGTYSTATNAETVVMMFAPRTVPRGFPSLRFFLGHVIADGAGTTTWRVYSMPKQYKGPAAFNSATMATGSYNASVITNSATYAINTNTVTLARSPSDESWLMVTAENAPANNQSYFYTLDAWPVM